MNFVDIVLIVVMVIAAAQGARRGLIASIGQLIAAVVAFAVAHAYTVVLGDKLWSIFGGPRDTVRFIVFMLIFFVVNAVIDWLVNWLNRAFHILSWIPFVSSLNSLFGFIVGLIEGIWLAGALAYILAHWPISTQWTAWLLASRVAQFAQPLFMPLLKVF